MVGLIAFFPASGAFVSLTQAALMDADPPEASQSEASQSESGRQGREAVQQQRMAAWNLAGSTGAVAGPILLAVVLTAGGSRRWAYLLLAGLTGIAVAIAAVGGPARQASSPPSTEQSSGHDAEPAGEEARDEGDDERPSLREALTAVRDGNVARWLILLEVTDLLLDVLTTGRWEVPS